MRLESCSSAAAVPENVTKAQQLAADPTVTALAGHGEIGNGRRDDNVRSTQYGNDPTYLVRRLKRDAPDVAEGLARGEYRP